MAITIHTVTPPVTGSSSYVISFMQSTPSTNVYVSVSISQSSTTYQAGDVIIVLLGCAYTSSTAPIPSGWTFLGGNMIGYGPYGYLIGYGHVVTAADVTAGSITANLPVDWGSGLVSTTATTTSHNEATAVAIVFRSSFGMCQLVNASVSGTDQAGTPYTLAAFPNATNTTYQFVAGLIFNTTARYSTTGTSGPWTDMPQYYGTGYYPEVAVGYVGVLASGVQVSLNFGVAVSVDALFAVQEGATPSAPTLTSPANATYEDLSGASTYTWTYNNTDGSTQAAYAFRNKIAGGSTYSYYNASTNALQTSEVWNASTSGSATLGAGILSNGNQYNWSVATQSNYGLQGPFASDFTVVGQAAPTVTLTAPTGTITSNTAEVAWSPVFPSGAYQTAYQIWVYDLATSQATGFTVGQTTGLISGSGVVASNAVTATVGTLPNFTTCVFYVQLTETGNELSAIVSTTATVNFTPPVAPTVVATPTTDANGTPIIEVTVTGHDNLLSANDASFEGGVGSWTARVNSTIAQSSAKALQGSYSLAVTSTAAGAFSVQAGTYPVTAGSSYSALLSSLAAAPPEVFSLNIDWLDVNSNVLSTSTGSSATDSTTAWTQVTVTGVAPTNAVSAKLWVYYGNSTASEVHYIDAAGLFEASTPPAWSPGGFVGGTTTTVTRSDGFVLRTTPTLNSTTQQATLSDYEWTSGSSYTYTATVSYSYGTTSLTSGSATTSAVTQSTTGWWLINPITPTSAFAPFVKSFTMLQLEQGASHTQIGQALPTIVSSVMGGKDGQLTVQTSTAAEWTTLQNLINSRATLWLTNYLGDGLYVRVGPSPGGMSSGNGLSSKQAQLAPSLASNPVRTIQLSYQQVAQP